MQSRVSRVVRGWIAGSFATVVAATSHGLADGSAPSGLALGAALVFAGLLGTFAIGRRPSLARLTAVVAVSQVAFHFVFSLLTPGTAAAASHHGVAELLAPAVAHHGTDPAMWVAHGLALLATLAFLRRAERALFELLRDCALGVIAVARRVPAIAPRRPLPPPVSTTAPRHPVLLLLQFVVSHRGPPLTAGPTSL